MRTLLLVPLAAVLLGCVPAPEADTRPTPAGRGDEETALRQDSVDRYAREITYRVRNPGCGGVGTGSAFAVADNVLVTNRHVVDDGLFQLELSTWDGRDFSVDASGVSTWADIALIWTEQRLPVVASIGSDPSPGDAVAAVGYPLGGPWTLSTGNVVDYVPGRVFGEGHDVIRFDAPISPGNSGGPLLDRRGDVVGVVYAIQTSGARYSLAIPLSTLEANVADRTLVNSVAGC